MHVRYSHRRPSYKKIVKNKFSQAKLEEKEYYVARKYTAKAHQFRSYYKNVLSNKKYGKYDPIPEWLKE